MAPSTQLSLSQLMIAAAGAGGITSFLLWAANSVLFMIIVLQLKMRC